MADGVDAAVEAVQSAQPKLMLDRTAPETQGSELAIRDHAMLPSRQLGDEHPTWSAFCMHAMRNADHVGFRPPRGTQAYSQRK
jgi:hypothetical protein